MNPLEEIAALQTIIDEILAGIQETIQSGEILSDDLQGLIAEEINLATQRIDELRAEQPQSPPITPPPLQENLYDNASLVWILAGGNREAFISYLHTIPDDALNNLASRESILNSFISRLSREYPEGIALQADGIQHAPLMSSNIYGFQYDYKNKMLRVRFNSGEIYEYQNVPKFVFNMFASGNHAATTTGQNRWGRWWRGKNPSLGSAFHYFIRNAGFPYQRLT